MKKPVPFGKYYLLERINVGGMAEVFRAKAYGVEGFERLVAVKRILPNIAEDQDFIRMFIDEAKIAVQLNHANIAQIFDLGVVDSSYYIALEHVHGRDVRAIFDRSRSQGEPMPIAQACFVIMKICEGLDYAHNKRDQAGRDINLVHRDVSPQNILISFEGEVKLIDFGIAKAAGKGNKTQAGILKGKFGYMSPEQVRGLPIDRRTDIFSCGIVLYELLTGERLFVGESDFSTLEKVRNVEILPPSTYNRKIPDELERIVLKALAKDVEDRYQNSIDLHDELQAYVYTAGEFYSRKDLAAWMKRTFTREIEEETAKLESYRQLKPPPELLAGRQQTAPELRDSRDGRDSLRETRPPPSPTRPPAVPAGVRRTTSMPSVPPPVLGQGGVGAVGKPPPPPSGRITQGMPVVPPPAAPPPTAAQMLAATPAPAPMAAPKADLSWDDDELETQIYDNPEEEAAARARKHGHDAPGPGARMPMAAASVAAPPADDEPDLSSLVRTSKGWGSPVQPGTSAGASGPPAGLAGIPGGTGMGLGGPGMGPDSPGMGPGGGKAANGSNGSNGNGAHVPSAIATGSNRMATPYFDERRESSSVGPLAVREQPFDPMGSFGAGVVPPQKPRTLMWAVLGGLALIGAAVAVVILTSRGTETTPGAGSAGVASGTAAASGTGATAPVGEGAFELVVRPAAVAGWRINGQPQETKPPVNVKIAAGKVQVAIDAPPGFMSATEEVAVEAGKTTKVLIELKAIDVVATFESTPPGAMVALLVGGKRIEVGPSPASYKIDPRERYDVTFEKEGYVSVTRPLSLTGSPEEKVVVNLERAAVAAAGRADRPVRDRSVGGPVATPAGGEPGGAKPVGAKPVGDKPVGDKPVADKPVPTGDKPAVDKPVPAAKGEGVLSLGAKPPCEIFIDGRNTGLKTPQREIKLSAGKHKITLLNNEFGIKESFVVDIKTDAPTKMVKDFSDRIQP